MLMHYVDDDETDIFSVESLFKSDPEYRISSSKTLSAVVNRSDQANFDCFLIDIHRPDARSMEQDVLELRRYSSAPVLFVTGGKAEDFRVRAAEAGADAVLEKEALSLDLLRQTFLNAKARADIFADASNDNSRSLRSAPSDVRRRPMALPLSYLENHLRRNADSAGNDETSHGSLFELQDAAQSLKSFAQRGLYSDTGRSPEAYLEDLRGDILRSAQASQVTVFFQVDLACFGRLDDPLMARLGMKHLSRGLFQLCSPGDTLSIKARPFEAGITVTIGSNRALAFNADYMFNERCPQYLKRFDSMFDLSIAAMLLNLNGDLVEIFSTGSLQKIRFTIPSLPMHRQTH